ncbi:MAG: hypothetical protein PHH26_06930 [Candidatus Thermoplasmatota archaeon]|nr:hypothetical protein [Candidatus Thermoplasmatota archaeon]
MVRKKIEIKRIGVRSVAMIMAVVFLIVGVLELISSAITGTPYKSIAGFPQLGAGLGFLVLIVVPIIYAIIGFFGGALAAWIYNLIAARVSGVKIEFDE